MRDQLRVHFLAVAVIILTAKSGEAGDRYVDSPRILSQLLAAAQASGGELEAKRSEIDGDTYVYYPTMAQYLGTCDAPFGKVHVAKLTYIRSGPENRDLPPAHAQRFVAFFDASPQLRGLWRVDFDEELQLRCSGTKLTFHVLSEPKQLQEKTLIDYADPAGTKGVEKSDGRLQVVVDGKLQPVITW